MARYERKNTQQVLADVSKDAAPDPNAVVARVGPDGRIELGRLDLSPPEPPAPEEEDESPANP